MTEPPTGESHGFSRAEEVNRDAPRYPPGFID